MTITPNLGLSVYNTDSGSATSFLNWRLAVSGESSNMTIIDSFSGETSASISILKTNTIYYALCSYVSANYYESTVSGLDYYSAGLGIYFNPNTTNNGFVTLNINSLGTKYLKKINLDGVLEDFSSGNLRKNKNHLFVYDGTYFVLSISTTLDQISSSGSTNELISTSACGILQPSGLLKTSVLTAISGSSVMSNTVGSEVRHNYSGITSGSYNKVQVDAFGHITSASKIGTTKTITFYSASATGGLVTQLNTVTIADGFITNWTQA